MLDGRGTVNNPHPTCYNQLDKIVLISTHLHPECYLNPVKDLSNNNHTGTLQVFFTPYFSPPLK